MLYDTFLETDGFSRYCWENLGRSGAVPTLTGDLEDALVQIQEAIAPETCNCHHRQS